MYMQILDESLREYIEIYKQEFGEELSMADARESASNFLEFYKLAMQPFAEELEALRNQPSEQAPHSP